MTSEKLCPLFLRLDSLACASVEMVMLIDGMHERYTNHSQPTRESINKKLLLMGCGWRPDSDRFFFGWWAEEQGEQNRRDECQACWNKK